MIDRSYALDEFNQVQVSINRLGNGTRGKGGVVVVTSEIHNGNTIIKVCSELRGLGIEPRVFSYLWSENGAQQPRANRDHFVLRTDQRGLLPWIDAPGKSREGQVKT